MDLFTCRYSDFHPAMGLPIRTTVGAARGFRHPLAGHAQLVSPTWSLVNLDDEAVYRTLYYERLAHAGVDAIRDQLAAIASAHADDLDVVRVVLLCFDDLTRPGAWCHRRMFADWWTQHTGEPVLELTNPPAPSLF